MIQVEMKEKGEITRLLHISVPADEVEKQYSTVTQQVQKSAVLPGFRKGKVPADIVSKKYVQEIREEVLERLVSRSYHQALEQTQSVPIDQPHFENLVLDRDKPMTYQVTVDVLPKVKLGNYEGIKLKKKAIQVTENQINEILERLRQQNAVLEPVEERPSQNGDVIVLDFDGKKDGNSLPGTTAKDYMLELGAGQTIPDFESNLAGMRTGESKTFPAQFPSDYHAAEMAGQTIEFNATVKSIQAKKLSPLDDDFAKAMGQFNTLEELKTRIRQDLEVEQNRQNQILLRDQVVQQLGKIAQVKIPELLINRSLDKLVADQEKRLREQNKTWEQIETTADNFRKQQREAVDFQWRSNLALREISQIHNIQVSQEELNAEVERLARLTRQTPQAVADYLERSRGWDEIYDRLRNDKTLDWIIGKAKITE